MRLTLGGRRPSALVTGLALAVVVGSASSAGAIGGIPVPTVPLGPPVYTVYKNDPAGAKGRVFYATGFSAADVGPTAALNPLIAPVHPSRLVIADKDGTEVWSRQAPLGQGFANFRTQTYRGKKVLTWWEGTGEGGHGSGAAYIADSHYRVIRKIELPKPYAADIHEFRLTPDGRALITAYREVTRDLTSIGGAKDAKMYDSLAFVVDVRTGKVLLRWNTIDHVPLTDTRAARPVPGSTVSDPFHINSIDLDPAGDLVISFRNLSAIYDVDVHTGRVKWVLGGAHPTLKAGPGVTFSFQHDAEFVDPTTLQLFNDAALGQDDPSKPWALVQGLSSVQRVKIDVRRRTATLVSNWTHPDDLVAIAMGNAQPLPNGHTFVGWGTAARISELDGNGKVVYDAAPTDPTYRAFLDTWPAKADLVAVPDWFVERAARVGSVRSGVATTARPLVLTAEGRRSGVSVGYRWLLGSKVVGHGRSVTPKASWKGRTLRLETLISGPGFETARRTTSAGRVG